MPEEKLPFTLTAPTRELTGKLVLWRYEVGDPWRVTVITEVDASGFAAHRDLDDAEQIGVLNLNRVPVLVIGAESDA